MRLHAETRFGLQQLGQGLDVQRLPNASADGPSNLRIRQEHKDVNSMPQKGNSLPMANRSGTPLYFRFFSQAMCDLRCVSDLSAHITAAEHAWHGAAR